jgi:hypothetical protein
MHRLEQRGRALWAFRPLPNDISQGNGHSRVHATARLIVQDHYTQVVPSHAAQYDDLRPHNPKTLGLPCAACDLT